VIRFRAISGKLVSMTGEWRIVGDKAPVTLIYRAHIVPMSPIPPLGSGYFVEDEVRARFEAVGREAERRVRESRRFAAPRAAATSPYPGSLSVALIGINHVKLAQRTFDVTASRLADSRSALSAGMLSLSGCDQISERAGFPDPTRIEAEGKAIGGACRHAGRGLEDCYRLNKEASKAAVFAGWKEMNEYMVKNNMQAVTPAIPPDSPRPGARRKPTTTREARESTEKKTKRRGRQQEAATRASDRAYRNQHEHLLRIASYNIHKGLSFFNRRIVLHDVRDSLIGLNADIVFLQEVQGHHARGAINSKPGRRCRSTNSLPAICGTISPTAKLGLRTWSSWQRHPVALSDSALGERRHFRACLKVAACCIANWRARHVAAAARHLPASGVERIRPTQADSSTQRTYPPHGAGRCAADHRRRFQRLASAHQLLSGRRTGL
jgi:hypothetical protein